ncbi:transglutaminaseTgpA domain-containing protein [Actinoplanes subtropicus]|uniref:transglutaminase family protein n=1 Tax=Actinoplanes subtropicus TaxID=543632 RepID=UPI0004C3F7FD|nr:transglutaminase domain-containing protein [Actinoplanes subtropicus]
MTSGRWPPGRFVELTGCLAGLAASLAVYRDFFDTGAFRWPASGAALGAVAIAVVAAARDVRRVVAVALHCTAFALLAATTALRATLHGGLPTARTASDLVWGVATGWADMLSISLPAPAAGRPLVAVLFLTWLAAAISVALLPRPSGPFGPALPPLVAFGVALVMTASQRSVHLAESAVLMAGLAIAVIARARGRSRAVRAESRALAADQAGRRSSAAMRPAAAGYVVAALGLAAALPFAVSRADGDGERRADPRPLRAAPLSVPETITPLSAVRAQLIEDPPRVLFDVDPLPGADLRGLVGIRTAALDRFDGNLWTTDQDFLAAGERLKRDPDLTHQRVASARLTIEQPIGPFLPVIGWPQRISFAGGPPAAIGFSPESGGVVTTPELPAGATYEVTGGYLAVPDLTPAARPARAGDDAAYRSVPAGLPPLIAALVHQITDGRSGALGKLTALSDYLRELPYNVDTPPGHSYAAISRMLSTDAGAAGEGFAEQHAAAFAVMARLLGYPARVAVGYRLPATPAGRVQVTTRDAHAWAEVEFERSGWVAFDPTDPANHKPRRISPIPPTPTPSAAPAGGSAAKPPAPATTPTPHSCGKPGAGDCSRPFDWARVIRVALVAVGAAIAATPIGVAVARAVRRGRRRRSGTPAARIVGAWREAVELPAVRRRSIPPGRTPEAMARNVPALAPLSSLVTTAVYCPRLLAPGDPQQAWTLEAAVRRRLYPGRRRVLRWLDQLNPVPLRSGAGRRGRQEAAGDVSA